MGGFEEIPVASIGPNPLQPRSTCDPASIDALAASIEAVGLLQPIVVRQGGGGYVLVAGERRLRAVKQVGLATIAAVVRSESDEGTSLAEALVENLQREDLGILEEAAAFSQLMEDYGMTHEDVGRHVG